jgi:ribonuclease R
MSRRYSRPRRGSSSPANAATSTKKSSPEKAARPPRKKRPAQRPPRDQRHQRPSNRPIGAPTAANNETEALRKRILSRINKEPIDATGLANCLQLSPKERTQLPQLLRQLETSGAIARIRRDHYILPQEADLITGTMQFHASGSAHLLPDQPGQTDVFISADNTATSMHGDKVVARLMPERPRNDWRPGSRDSGRREGRVIRILTRASETIVGTLQKSKNFFYVVADDPRFVHNVYVPEPRPPLAAKPGDKVVVHLEAWASRHVNPEGKITEVLGETGRPGVDMLAIIRKHRLPEKFPQEVIREARTRSTQNPSDELSSREDHRQDFVLTIDPDDARDFDDAICVERSRSGWQVAVHIADVSHYVRPKTALDREALARGNSVYLPDRVIPMLPEELSNGICSLRPDEDRLAFSVFAEVSHQGVVKKSRFAKSIIRSVKRLTYKQALAILQKPPVTELEKRVHVAWEVSSQLRRRRFEQGSLDLDFPETKVWVNAEGRPIRIERVENDISHQLIEELMLLANEAVARELKLRKQPTIYRVHEPPDEDRLLEFRENALLLGARCGDLTQRPELQKLLASVRGEPHEFAVKLGLLKSLKRARYSEEPLGHYGLAKTNYLHFTSPIRRYADLVAHRALERHLGLTKVGPDSAQLAVVAEHISTTERVAAEAEKEAVRLKKLEYFQAQLSGQRGQSFLARIIEVRNYGLFVELPDFLLTGLIHVSALEGDFYVFDPARSQFQGRRNRRTFAVGGELEVVVSRVDLFKQQVDFAPAPDR